MQREVRLGVNFSLRHQCLYYRHHSFEEQKKLFLGLVHTYRDIFESATFSFRIQKFPLPHLSVLISNLPVHAYPTRIWIHSSSQDSSRDIANRAWFEVAILNTVFTVKNWARSCYVTGFKKMSGYSVHMISDS